MKPSSSGDLVLGPMENMTIKFLMLKQLPVKLAQKSSLPSRFTAASIGHGIKMVAPLDHKTFAALIKI